MTPWHAGEPQALQYLNDLQPLDAPPPLLADHPSYVEPLVCERRFLAPPVVADAEADLKVRSWRYWYNARGIVEMENRLSARATAILMVHPWGLDDGHGLRTPEPAGCAFFCTEAKNRLCLAHIRDVVNPFLARLRGRVAVVGYSLPGVEDDIRRLMYASASTRPDQLDPARGEALLAECLAAHPFAGEALPRTLSLDAAPPLRSYLDATPSTDASDRYNGEAYWDLPMPVSAAVAREPEDLVFYDGEGYPKVRDYLQSRGVRHVLLLGYATDMCVRATTCGYENLSRDFNLHLVGDATLATFPGSDTPRFATQVALANAALTQMVTQAGWVETDPGGA